MLQKQSIPSRVPALRGNRESFVIWNSRLLICRLRSDSGQQGGPHLTGWCAVVKDMVVIMGWSRTFRQSLMEACSDVLFRHMCSHDCCRALLALVISLESHVRRWSSSEFHLFLPWLPLPLRLSPSHTCAPVKQQVVVQKPLWNKPILGRHLSGPWSAARTTERRASFT